MPSFFEKLKKSMRTSGTPKIIKEERPEKKLREESSSRRIVKNKPKLKETPKKELKKEPPKPVVEELPMEETIEPEKPIKKKIKVTESASEESLVQETPSSSDAKEWFEPEGQLAIDVFQTDGEIVIQSAIAGVRPENLDIAIENDMVTIKGERNETIEKSAKNYFYQECYWGRFSREIILPAEVDASRVQAKMQDGILTIRIPKIEREKKRKIAIDK